MKQLDLSNVQAIQEGSYRQIVPGGYICRITKVEDMPFNPATGKGDFLKVELDITEGDFAGYFGEQYQQFGKWRGILYRSYSENSLGMFKGFVKAVQESNPGYQWQWHEETLVGKLIGVVFGEEEYVDRTYHTAVSIKPRQIRSVQAIRAGDFKVPPIKKLNSAQAAQVQQVEQDTQAGYTPIQGADAPVPF